MKSRREKKERREKNRAEKKKIGQKCLYKEVAQYRLIIHFTGYYLNEELPQTKGARCCPENC